MYCCCDCPLSVACCNNDLSNLNVCTDRDCHNKFLICLFDGESDDCVYSSTIENDDSITFGDGLTTGGIINPIEFIGEGQVSLYECYVIYQGGRPGQASILNNI